MPFLQILDPTLPLGSAITLNVTDLEEQELQWSGEEEKSFAGSYLSTLRDPRRQFTATVEFLTPTEVDAFRRYVMNYDAFTGRPTSYKRVSMFPEVASLNAHRSSTSLPVNVIMGRMTPHEYRNAGTLTQSWTVELTIRELDF